MTDWFTSDTHFNHVNIIPYCKRPYASIHEMNNALIDNWNACVKEEDTVFHLGDFGMGSFKDFPDIRSRLKGSIVLILGNHDLRHSAQKWKTIVGINEVWDFLYYEDVYLCHYPYEGDTQDQERFKDRRLQDCGHWLLHGHVHDMWHVKGRQINVGVDVNNYRPISFEEIRKLQNEI
jgi:calcineurin-like phosphoesterase family protein